MNLEENDKLTEIEIEKENQKDKDDIEITKNELMKILIQSINFLKKYLIEKSCVSVRISVSRSVWATPCCTFIEVIMLKINNNKITRSVLEDL